jgi:hypothetical protein
MNLDPPTYPRSREACEQCGHLETSHALDVNDEGEPIVCCQRPRERKN